jgi:hypothetical protein
VVLVPIAMMIVLLVVQLCLWAHASTLAQEAATVGEQSASAMGGSPATGQMEARQQLSATARNLVIDPSVQAQTLAGGIVEIKVSGVSESIIPWIHLPVSATRVGLSQEFRESG